MELRKQLRKQARNQKGFTLIEIIAVLVVLGVLAAMALPRYNDMQVQARQKAAEGAAASGQSTCSLVFARLLLTGTTYPTNTAVKEGAEDNPPASDAYNFAFSADDNLSTCPDAGGVTVTVTAKDGNGSGSADWCRPSETYVGGS